MTVEIMTDQTRRFALEPTGAKAVPFAPTARPGLGLWLVPMALGACGFWIALISFLLR